jgi:two-component system, OmpR family, phosphate regulon sensor histidine kinase PhoR
MLSGANGDTVAESRHQMLEMIERAAGRLRNLIEDLLTLAKVESGSIHPVRQAVNLADVISTAARTMRPLATSNGLTLTSACPPTGLAVEGDPDQLDRALVNLMSNAVKFTPTGGHISVTGEAADGWAVVTVQDTGIGIPDADREHLFTRFFRASNAVGRGITGTGLGLAIIRSIAVGHGGEVRLDSREGEGTTVTFRLPLKDTLKP